MLTQLPIRLGIVLSASRTPLRHVSMSADLVDAKKTMRKAMKAELKGLDAATITTASERACERLLALEAFERSASVSVYLSMPAECQTHKLLEAAFARGKRVFVPKITGSGREDMRMVHVESLEQLRFLENDIQMHVLDAHGDPWGIETRQDYDAYLQRLSAQRT